MTGIADWSNFLTAQAGAAATLTGLVFVAVSINLSRVLSIPGLTGRAAESLAHLFGVLIASACALIPQPMVALGAEILVTGSFLWLFQTALQVGYARSRTAHPRYWLFTRTIQTQCATIPICISGILLLRGSFAGLYWLALGFIFSLISGVVSAWVLLVEIMR